MARIHYLQNGEISLEGVFRLNGGLMVTDDGATPFLANQSMGGFRLTDLGAPVDAGDATNKDYVDNLVLGLSWKASARVATTANIVLSGLQTIDGIALSSGDRVLVKDQSTQTENGIYVASSGAWSRSSDANTGPELVSATLAIEVGTLNADTRWTQTADSITIGVTPITWVFIGKGSGVKAATIIVSTVASEGDYTDIQSAINALPAQGGLILVREGTYSISSTLALPNKPVWIRGCGIGATIIDIGANTISAFTIASANKYGFSDLRINGGGAASQRGLNVSAFADVRMASVEMLAIEKPFLTSSGFELRTIDCHFRVPNLGTAYYCDGQAVWYATNTICDHSGTPRGGFLNEPELHWNNCTAWVVNGGATGWVYLNNCYFFSDVPLTLPNYAAGSIITGSLFESAAGTPARYIDIVAGCDNVVVSSCVFSTFSSEAIRLGADRCAISGNTNCKVTETGAANDNNYSGNKGLTQTSTILGATSIVNGVANSQLSGPTNAIFIVILNYQSLMGMMAIGTIKNTGANPMEVKETVVDLFGGSANLTHTVPAGDHLTLDLQIDIGVARPPYVTYQIEVRHTGAATSYDLALAMHGAVR
jgi:hypothetical protein